MVDESIFIFFCYGPAEQTDESALGVKLILIGFSLYLNWSLSSWIDGSVMEVKPIFYRLSMVDESIFIFFYYGPIEQTDESAMRVKPIFIGFSMYLNWSLSFWIDGSVMGVKPIFIGFLWWMIWSSSSWADG
jgi:hypothetical protein